MKNELRSFIDTSFEAKQKSKKVDSRFKALEKMFENEMKNKRKTIKSNFPLFFDKPLNLHFLLKERCPNCPRGDIARKLELDRSLRKENIERNQKLSLKETCHVFRKFGSLCEVRSKQKLFRNASEALILQERSRSLKIACLEFD